MNLVTVISLIKQYWWIAAIASVLVYSHFKMSNMEEILAVANKSHIQQITQLKSLHKEELEKRDKIVENYKKEIADIEEKYNKEVNKIKKVRQNRIKELVDKFYKIPEGLKNEIQKRYGFEYVPPKSCD